MWHSICWANLTVPKGIKTCIKTFFLSCNKGNIDHFQIQGIERVTAPYRGGDMLQKILKREVFWIFTLDTRLPKGMNSEFDISCYYH
ncbi:hypothetical protein XELAEV_18047651mg [Xenopus laevis]|uniref:Uncharacterized protein n=1 Tax=Xenopus laevis TaxID=8355 RepID=A0A974H1R8_XENLA|nr:hypothetical protein XELAEV_18047651mg [Xenopus laevis]